MAHGVSNVGVDLGSPRAGVLVVRAWVEDHPTATLRAVVTELTEVSDAARPVRTAAASIDDVCRLVHDWLVAVVGE